MPEESAPPQTYRDLAGLQLSSNSPGSSSQKRSTKYAWPDAPIPPEESASWPNFRAVPRSSASKTNTAFGRPIAIGTSIVHGRCLYSEQY
jgi:hypothetical protein